MSPAARWPICCACPEWFERSLRPLVATARWAADVRGMSDSRARASNPERSDMTVERTRPTWKGQGCSADVAEFGAFLVAPLEAVLTIPFWNAHLSALVPLVPLLLR